MVIKNEPIPLSSFLSVEKDAQLIINKIINNSRLKKLLYYTSKDALEKPRLDDEKSLALIGTNIQMFPKLRIDPDVKNYLFIDFDGFHPNNNNPYFTDNNIHFDILVHMDQWFLKDFEMRPYKIAGELDAMFQNEKLTGIGTTQLVYATNYVYNDEFAGFSLTYRVVHGDEDKKNLWNPKAEEAFLDDFNFDLENEI